MKLTFIISFIIQLLLVNAVSVQRSDKNIDSSDYLITVPKVLANEQDKICIVWLNEANRPASEKLDVKIKETGSETVIEQVSAQLSSESVCVEIPTKKFSTKVHRADIEVTVGKHVSEKHEVQVRPNLNLVLIETSKPVYRPSETIKFSILTVDQELKPVTEQFKKVWIENPYFTSVKQWRNVDTKDGIVSFDLETAEENILGQWRIKALTQSNNLIVKVFELTRYLEPKIQIEVVKPNYLLVTDKQTEIEIKANDQFDYPVKGNAKITVGYKPAPFEQSREVVAQNMPTQKFEQQINGKTKITLDHEKLQANSKHNAQRLLVLNIEIEQEKTNLTQTLIQELPISSRKVIITLPSARIGKQYFKANNLPFKSYFTVEHPDLSVAEYEKVTVCYEQRQKAWIQEKEKEVCKEFTSDKDGIVRYETRPIQDKNIQQLFVTVKTNDNQEEQSFVLHPWFNDSEMNFIINPQIKREQCLKKHNVEIIFSNLNKKTDAFYQVVGRKSEKPVKFTIEPSKLQKIENNLSKMNLEIDSELLSSVHQPIARIVVFLKDSNKSVVADYDAFEVDCKDKQSEIKVNSVQSSENKNNEHYTFDVKINSPENNAKCVLQVSQQEARHELMKKRVARLMEKMDLNLDLINRDKCEKDLYIRNQKSSNLRNIIPQEQIINYRSSWDVFNKVGLQAFSNMDLDKAPCEAEIYPEGFSKEMIENFDQVKYNLVMQRNYYMNELAEITKLEQNITDDLVQWMNVNSNQNQRVVIRADQIGEEGQLVFDAICIAPKTGIHFAHKKIAQNAVQPFEVDIIAPKQIVVNEIVHIYVDLHKQNPHSVPVVVEPVSNSNYEITLETGEHSKFNFEGEHHRVVYRIKALTAIAQTTLQFTVHDGQNGQHYPTKVHTHHLSIVNYGSIVRNTEYQILFNEQNSPKQIDLISQQSNDKNRQQIKNLTVTTDILEILVPRNQQHQKPRHSQSARDGLSLQYKSPVELVSYLTILAESEQNSQDEQQKQRLRNEMERVYQILETKRLHDGSYSTFIGKSAASPFADVSLTSNILNLYVQLKHKEQLPQISDASLKQTYIFLHRLQNQDGAFPSPIQDSNAFPMSLKNPLDVTAYVAMQMVEASSDFNSPITKNAIRYVVQQLKQKSLTENDNNKANDDQQLASAIVSYLYALKGKNEKAEKWSSKVDSSNLNQLAKKQHGEQIIAIKTLMNIKMNKKSEIERLAKWLFNKQQEISQDQLFSSPIMSKAIVKAWNALNGHNQSVKVNGQTIGKTQVRLGDNLTKVIIENKGFVIATYKKEQNRLSENQKDFKITVNGLKRGFKSCAQRSMNVCYKSKDEQQKVARNPVMNIQIPTGFQVDELLLASMLTYGSASQLDSFDVRHQNLHLLLKPAQSRKSHCIEIPIVKVQSVEQRQKYFIQMINYYDYQQQLSRKHIAQYDTVFYELTNECEIIDRPLFTLGLEKMQRQSMNFRPQQQHHENNVVVEKHHGPLEIVNCPEDVQDSCPVCLNELNKSHEKQVCETKFVSTVHRRDLKTHEKELFDNQNKNTNKRCIILPLKLEQIVLNKEKKLQQNDDVLVYVNEKCRCSYINEQQGHGKAILVKNDVENLQTKPTLQLTKDDTLVVYLNAQSNQLPSCMSNLKNLFQHTQDNQQQQKSRTKREADLEKNDDEKEDPKNSSKRSGYGQSSYSPPPAYAPAPAYPAPAAPAYPAPAPAYPAPAPAPMSYDAPAAPAYPAPAPAYPAPAPAYPAPAPAYPAPAPAYPAPAPAYAPAPLAYDVPAPAYAPPAPSPASYQVYEEPKQQYYAAPPAYGPPAAPAYPAPAPAYPAPAPVYPAPAPAPAYGPPAAPAYPAPAPAPAYGPPAAPAYPAPAPAYPAPAPAYPAPAPAPMSYDAPAPAYGPPAAPAYPAPAPAYPAPAYGPPAAPAYPAPAPAYPAPAPAYAPAPAPSYGPAPAPSYDSSYPEAPASYSGGYKRSAGYDAPAAPYAPTQPEYAQPQYSAYPTNPGYLNTGYMQAPPSYLAPPAAPAPAPAYPAPVPAYPAPVPAYPAPAPVYPAAPVTYKPASPYKRSAAYDLASSASNAYQAIASPYGDSYGADSYGSALPPYAISIPNVSSYAPAYGAAPALPAPAYGAAPALPAPTYGAAPALPAPTYGAAPALPAPTYGAAPALPAPTYGAAPALPAPTYGAAPALPAPAYAAAPAPAPVYPVASPAASYAPSGASYGSTQTTQYAVLYTPVRYATAYIPTYVQASSGYGAVPAASPAPASYGSYASASDKSSIFSRTEVEDTECKQQQPAKTCPVCEDSASLELINNICNLEVISTVRKANQTSSIKNKSVCGKISKIENMRTNESSNEEEQKEFNYSIKQNCECPQLRKVNIFSNAIVLAPRRNVNGKNVQLDESAFVLNDSAENRHEIYTMAQQCSKINKDDLEDF